MPDPDENLTLVRRYAALEAPSGIAFDRVARMAAVIFDTPMATVSIVEEDRIWFAAAYGLDGVAYVGTEPGLCATAVHHDGPYVVSDTRSDARTRDHPLVVGGPRVRFYAGAPIVTPGGLALGAVSVLDRKRRRVQDQRLLLLCDLADMVAEMLHAKLMALDLLREEQSARRRELDHRLMITQRHALPADAEPGGGASQPECCQLGGTGGCGQQAELKVADSWGESAWGCWEHAEDALRQVPSVYLAQETARGLAAYRGRVTRPPSP